MASIRESQRKDGTTYSELFTVDGRQTSVSFKDRPGAERFRQLVDLVGGKRALKDDDREERRRSEKSAVNPCEGVTLTRTEGTSNGVPRQGRVPDPEGIVHGALLTIG